MATVIATSMAVVASRMSRLQEFAIQGYILISMPDKGASADSAQVRVTIRDIAERAGVAPSTVSRALTSSDRVNEQTRERILAVATELNYVTRPSAPRPSRTTHSPAIAFLIPDVTNPYYFALIQTTQIQLRAAGYTQLLIDTGKAGELETETLDRMKEVVDGFIIAGSHLTDEALGSLATNTPLVAINRTPAAAPWVHIDSPTGYGQVLEHLYSLGHRKIAYVGPSDSWLGGKRWASIEQKAGELDMAAVQVDGFLPTFESGPAAADAFLRTHATACLASNDLLAVGILGRFHQRGIRVPDDVSVVGCDDTIIARMSFPPLTTLTAPVEEAGRIAVSSLLGLIGGSAYQTRHPYRGELLPIHLTIRESTGPAPRPS